MAEEGARRCELIDLIIAGIDWARLRGHDGLRCDITVQ